MRFVPGTHALIDEALPQNERDRRDLAAHGPIDVLATSIPHLALAMVVDDARVRLTVLPDGRFQLTCPKPYIQETTQTLPDALLAVRRRLMNLDARIYDALEAIRRGQRTRETLTVVGPQRPLTGVLFGKRAIAADAPVPLAPTPTRTQDEAFDEEYPEHTCPFKMEIHDDSTTLCRCSPSQEDECRMDV